PIHSLSSFCVLVLMSYLFFSFYCSAHHRDLHSFPTRRSSDLHVPRILDRVGEVESLEVVVGADAAQRIFHPRPALGLLQQCPGPDRKSTRLNSSHVKISYAVFCLKKKKKNI